MRKIRRYEAEAFAGCPLICQIIPMGKDYTVAVCGGTLSHIGSVVMAQARPSLTGQGTSATSSVLNCAGHKDEAVARMFAEEMAVHGNCTVVCTCGIHVDAITQDQIAAIQKSCAGLLQRILAEADQD